MPSPLFETLEPVAPSDSEAELAREASRRLAPHLEASNGLRIQLIDEEGQGEDLSIPVSALRLLVHILREMAQGNAVSVVPVQAELTTQQAADLLNVSRPYVVKLLDEGKIPHRTVGKFRRVRFDDLMAYKRKDDQERLKVLEELSALDQELGLGY